MPDILTGVLTEERLQPFLKYLKEEEITDVDWNGKDLWLKNIYSEKIKVPKEEHNVTPEYIVAITQHIANSVSKRFNKEIPCLEAETGLKPCMNLLPYPDAVSASGRQLNFHV